MESCDTYPTLCDLSKGLWIALLVVDSLLIALSLFVLGISFYAEKGWKITRIIKLLVPLVPAARIVNISLIGDEFFIAGGGYSKSQSLIQIITGGLPGYIFISTYMLLVIFWMILYSYAHVQSYAIISLMRVMVLSINFGVYSVWAAFIIAMSFIDDYSQSIHAAEAVYAATLYVFATMVLWLTCLLSGVFFVRSLITYIDVFWLSSVSTAAVVSAAIFLFFCEAFPIIVLLMILTIPMERIPRISLNKSDYIYNVAKTGNYESNNSHSSDKY